MTASRLSLKIFCLAAYLPLLLPMGSVVVGGASPVPTQSWLQSDCSDEALQQMRQGPAGGCSCCQTGHSQESPLSDGNCPCPGCPGGPCDHCACSMCAKYLSVPPALMTGSALPYYFHQETAGTAPTAPCFRLLRPPRAA